MHAREVSAAGKRSNGGEYRKSLKGAEMMRKSANAIAAIVVTLTLSAAVAAQTTITFYDPRPNQALSNLMDRLVAEFEAQNPDIRIEHVHIAGYNQINEQTLVAWAGGAPPNVVIIEQSRWFGFALDGMFMPIDSFLERDPAFSLDDIYPGIRDHLSWDGKLWGLPYNISTPLIYFNRDLFRRSGLEPVAPRTWDEILAKSRAIARDTNGDSNPDVWGIDFYAWGWLFEAWLGQNGARVAAPDGRRYTFDSDEAVEAMEFTQALVLQHRVARQGTGINDFWAGRLGMTERSTASLADYSRNAANNNIDMWVAPLACQKECYAPIGGGNIHILNTGTPQQREAAWRFVKFLFDTENLALMGSTTGYMAGRASSIQSDILQHHFSDEPRALVTYQQLVHARPRAKVPNWAGDIADMISSFATRQHRDGVNVRQELTEMARRANIMLEEWYASRANRPGR